MPTNELYPDNFRDIRETLLVQHTIDVLLVVFYQLFCSKLASGFIFFLQLLQPQFHAADTSLVRTF